MLTEASPLFESNSLRKYRHQKEFVDMFHKVYSVFSS